jgi:hypothetical protein
MFTEERILETIRSLEDLASDFAVAAHAAAATEQTDAQQRACKEALLTISVLLPKLHAVRGLSAESRCMQPICHACEGD